MGIIDAMKETTADVSSASHSSEQMTSFDKGLLSATVSFMASITLVNTQLIHQFVFRHPYSTQLPSSLRAGITLYTYLNQPIKVIRLRCLCPSIRNPITGVTQIIQISFGQM